MYKIIIVTDSMSAIDGIINNKHDHFLVNKSYSTMRELVMLGVPSHIETLENEIPLHKLPVNMDLK